MKLHYGIKSDILPSKILLQNFLEYTYEHKPLDIHKKEEIKHLEDQLQNQNERTFNFFQTEKPDNKEEEEASLVVKFINRNEKNHKMVSNIKYQKINILRKNIKT